MSSKNVVDPAGAWSLAARLTAQLRAICPVAPLTVETHERGLQIARRLGLSIYDGTIVASALLSGCATLYTEDMQDGRVIDGQLAIRNPFV